MSGVLDSKKRVLDVILTELGRDQMNRGEFEVSFVTFSDKGSQYVDDGTGVASSILDNVYFETYSSPADEIIPEIDNEGDFLLTKKVSPTLTVNNRILYEQTDSGYKQVDAFANISSFTNITTGRWSGLQILKTESELDDFTVDRESLSLEFSSKNLPRNVDNLKPILVDPRFTGNVNTMYLPPVSEVNGVSGPMRAYNRFGPENTMENIIQGEIIPKSWDSNRIQLGTENTYESYNLIGQAFMKRDQSVRKYLIVDGGEYTDAEGIPVSQVYHLGFIFKDEFGTSKFSRGFSLVFHNGELS